MYFCDPLLALLVLLNLSWKTEVHVILKSQTFILGMSRLIRSTTFSSFPTHDLARLTRLYFAIPLVLRVSLFWPGF